MDMKRFLQAVDGGSTPTSKSDNEMKKFVSIISEGRGPSNRLTQAETITLNRYTEPAEKRAGAKENSPKSGIHEIFKQVEEELLESKQQQHSAKQQKVQQLVEKVIDEVGNNGHASNLKKHLMRTKKTSDRLHKLAIQGATIDNKTRRRQRTTFHETSTEDTVTLNIPLLIRIVEYAKEDAKTDMDLHSIVENMLDISEEGQVLTMDDYEKIVNTAKLVSEQACGNEYKKQGTKIKKTGSK